MKIEREGSGSRRVTRVGLAAALVAVSPFAPLPPAPWSSALGARTSPLSFFAIPAAHAEASRQAGDRAALGRAAAALIEELAIARALSGGEEIALTLERVDASMDGAAALEALRAAIDTVHPNKARVLTSGAGEDLARGLGAEWLLSIVLEVERGEPRIAATLRPVDRGLWSPAPGPGAVESAAIRPLSSGAAIASSVPAPQPPTFTLTPGPSVSLPVRIHHLDSAVLALAACDLDGDGADELIALAPAEVGVFALEGGALIPLGHRSLADVPRAAVTVRDPIGGLACADLDGDGRPEIAAGSSRQDAGVVLTPKVTGRPGRRSRIDLAVSRLLAALPLAPWPGGGLIQGRPDGGRNRWQSKLLIGRPGQESEVDAGGPLYELATRGEGAGRAGRRIAALSTDYRVYFYGDAFDSREPAGTSGAGISFAEIGPSSRLVATSSATSGTSRDTVRLLPVDPSAAPGWAPVAATLSGAIVASTAGKLRPRNGSEIVLAIRAADQPGSDLYLLRVEGEPR